MEDCRSYLFILNPNSGRRQAEKEIVEIEKQCNNYNVKCEFFLGELKSAKDYIVNYAPDFDRVVAAGGDGTIYSTLNALMKTKQRNLAILPLGTGNDFYKTFKEQYPRENFWKHLFTSKGYNVDVGAVNELYFLNIASFGYDAHVVDNYNKITKKVSGKLAYIISIIYTLFNYKKIEFSIDIEGNEYIERVLLMSAANGIYYGGGFPIAPESKLNDGYLDFTIIKNLNNIAVPFLFPTLLLKKHTKLTHFVKLLKLKEFTIYSPNEVILNLDGELHLSSGEFKFNILEKEINVI